SLVCNTRLSTQTRVAPASGVIPKVFRLRATAVKSCGLLLCGMGTITWVQPLKPLAVTTKLVRFVSATPLARSMRRLKNSAEGSIGELGSTSRSNERLSQREASTETPESKAECSENAPRVWNSSETPCQVTCSNSAPEAGLLLESEGESK